MMCVSSVDVDDGCDILCGWNGTADTDNAERKKKKEERRRSVTNGAERPECN